jgi:hypothetical protein
VADVLPGEDRRLGGDPALPGLGFRSVDVLGIRRSFIFRRLADGLIPHGPLAMVRHPQFLFAIGITLFNALIHTGYRTSWRMPNYSNPLPSRAL